MKKFFALGICALVLACGNPQKAAETAGPDPNSDTTNFKSATTQATMPASAGTDSSKSTTVASAVTTNTPNVVNSNTAKAPETKTGPAQPVQETGNAAAIKKGEALYSKLDCFACHKPDIKIVGPAYKDVAKKYENTPANINYLANKIIKGGSGVWGQVPMAPHPTLSMEDAKALAQYVLSVK